MGSRAVPTLEARSLCPGQRFARPHQAGTGGRKRVRTWPAAALYLGVRATACGDRPQRSGRRTVLPQPGTMRDRRSACAGRGPPTHRNATAAQATPVLRDARGPAWCPSRAVPQRPASPLPSHASAPQTRRDKDACGTGTRRQALRRTEADLGVDGFGDRVGTRLRGETSPSPVVGACRPTPFELAPRRRRG